MEFKDIISLENIYYFGKLVIVFNTISTNGDEKPMYLSYYRGKSIESIVDFYNDIEQDRLITLFIGSAPYKMGYVRCYEDSFKKIVKFLIDNKERVLIEAVL